MRSISKYEKEAKKLIKNYIKMLKREFSHYNGKKFSKDLMAGITVTAVALPLALAFGEACGASASAGLVTAIIAGVVISILSGASFQISGPTGAMSAVLVGVVAGFGLDGVFVVSLMAGILVLLAAIFGLGRFVELIPKPVVTGFTSGIALIIALGQVDNFFGTASVGEGAIEKLVYFLTNNLGNINISAVLTALIVVVIMVVWPKKWGAVVPSSLVGLIVASVVSISLKLDVAVVGEIPKTIFLSERLNFATVEWAKIGGYISPAISIAALAMIESLLCGASASKMKDEPFDANIELVAQGVGNIIVPFFGGVPATAAIARTSVAIKSGAVTRLCGVIHALGLLLSMFLLAPVMAKVPMSALAGVLMVTAWRMNEWTEIKHFFKHKMGGAISKFFITMIATVVFDLTIAIVIGILYSAIFVFVKNGFKFKRLEVDVDGGLIRVKGPVFFGNDDRLLKTVKALAEEGEVTLDVSEAIVADTTAKFTLDEIESDLPSVTVVR